MKTLTIAAIAALTLLALAPAEARHRHRAAVQQSSGPVTQFCGDRYCPVGVRPAAQSRRFVKSERRIRGSIRTASIASAPRFRAVARPSSVEFIPNPPGCSRVSLSCACRLAAYWGLGSGLDAVRTWPKVFARAHGPGPGIAAVRNGLGHIMGIVGGGPGAWRVVDFNSGHHLNRSYVVADFRGYFFVDPRSRVALR